MIFVSEDVSSLETTFQENVTNYKHPKSKNLLLLFFELLAV